MKPKTVLLSALAATAIGGATLATFSTLTPETAIAQSGSAKAIVDQAIREGVVGETAAGYLALVSGSADTKIVNAMNEVNIGRKSVYTRLAREQNVQVEVVAALTGEKQIAKAPKGAKVLTKEGRWVTVQ